LFVCLFVFVLFEVESCWNGQSMRQSWGLPTSSALDNIDGSVPVVAILANPSGTVQHGTTIDTQDLGIYTVQFFAEDKAGIFGFHGMRRHYFALK
jgi:hypothetical protein